MPRGRGHPEEAPWSLGACADPDSAVSLGSAAFCSEHCCGHRDVGLRRMAERRGAARPERRHRLVGLSLTVRSLRSRVTHATLRLQA